MFLVAVKINKTHEDGNVGLETVENEVKDHYIILWSSGKIQKVRKTFLFMLEKLKNKNTLLLSFFEDFLQHFM